MGKIESSNRIGLYLCVLLVVGGCGAKLNRASVGQIEIGKTTSAELLTRFGDPDDVDTVIDAAGKSEIRTHRYQNNAQLPLVSLVDYRFLQLDISSGLLRGYFFAATQGENKTFFEVAAGDTVKAGMTKAQVQQVLGPPSGIATAPTRMSEIKDLVPAGSTSVWIFTAVDGANAMAWSSLTQRMLVVGFNDAGICTGANKHSVQWSRLWGTSR